MNAAFVVLCGCLQMIRIIKTSISTITETQSKVPHSKACREPTVPANRRLRMMAMRTEVKRARPVSVTFSSRNNI